MGERTPRPVPARAVIVVPCYNEERRLDENALLELTRAGVELILVDDGSTDGTRAGLAKLAARAEDGMRVLAFDRNAGKAEAVRRGLRDALGAGAPVVGYYDADGATPASELLRLLAVLEDDPGLAVVFGSRVAVLGSRIERSALRHYVGRVYATLASLALGVPAYDTQCGAKVFRANAALASAVAEPFRASWTFDVELLHRLLVGGGTRPGTPVAAVRETPIEGWRDVPGSAVRPRDALRAVVDLLRVWADRAHRRLGPR